MRCSKFSSSGSCCSGCEAGTAMAVRSTTRSLWRCCCCCFEAIDDSAVALRRSSRSILRCCFENEGDSAAVLLRSSDPTAALLWSLSRSAFLLCFETRDDAVAVVAVLSRLRWSYVFSDWRRGLSVRRCALSPEPPRPRGSNVSTTSTLPGISLARGPSRCCRFCCEPFAVHAMLLPSQSSSLPSSGAKDAEPGSAQGLKLEKKPLSLVSQPPLLPA